MYSMLDYSRELVCLFLSSVGRHCGVIFSKIFCYSYTFKAHCLLSGEWTVELHKERILDIVLVKNDGSLGGWR